MTIEQGNIITVEKMEGQFLIVSKNFFNTTEQAILCPVVHDTFCDPLHIEITTEDVHGIVMCEQIRLVDLRYRGHKKVGQIPYSDIINITDAIQSIFDYYDLYGNSKVSLIFYYSEGYEQTDAIYRLINSYGKTLSNREQGKNLIHKLLLENRLKIVEVS